MPAAKLFQNLTSDSRHEAAERVRNARQAAKKNKKDKTAAAKRGRLKKKTQQILILSMMKPG
jgi:hypothetical protein